MTEVFDYSALFGLMWFLQILDTLHWATKKKKKTALQETVKCLMRKNLCHVKSVNLPSDPFLLLFSTQRPRNVAAPT